MEAVAVGMWWGEMYLNLTRDQSKYVPFSCVPHERATSNQNKIKGKYPQKHVELSRRVLLMQDELHFVPLAGNAGKLASKTLKKRFSWRIVAGNAHQILVVLRRKKIVLYRCSGMDILLDSVFTNEGIVVGGWIALLISRCV